MCLFSYYFTIIHCRMLCIYPHPHQESNRTFQIFSCYLRLNRNSQRQAKRKVFSGGRFYSVSQSQRLHCLLLRTWVMQTIWNIKILYLRILLLDCCLFDLKIKNTNSCFKRRVFHLLHTIVILFLLTFFFVCLSFLFLHAVLCIVRDALLLS